jgi:hypothetical protein
VRWEARMTKFSRPKRRAVRQRSGYSVTGVTTGNECRLTRAARLSTRARSVTIAFRSFDQELPPQFGQPIGLLCVGGYLHTSTPVALVLGITCSAPELAEAPTARTAIDVAPDKWSKFGAYCRVPLLDAKTPRTVRADVTLTIQSRGAALGTVELYGLETGPVVYYTNHPELMKSFGQYTSLYMPEIFYFGHDQAIPPTLAFATDPPRESVAKNEGGLLVLKACNRCKRYLPVDLNDESNVLAFSKHCKSQKCSHAAFSVLTLEAPYDKAKLGLVAEACTSGLAVLNDGPAETYKIAAEHGLQLECRACKKFYVNAPLNPARNSSQHREDGLRRRALDVLVSRLLDHPRLYSTYRLSHDGLEFDTSIWLRFDKRCFNCGKVLASPRRDMDVDHTLPLAYLWPLDESATCLCKACNSKKHDRFPYEFYDTDEKLRELAERTGLSLNLLMRHRHQLNMEAANGLISNVVWFFDDFLAAPEYQKIHQGKKVSDLIYQAVSRVFEECLSKDGNLLVHYRMGKAGDDPTSITIGPGTHVPPPSRRR